MSISLDHLRELRYDRQWTPRRWLGMGVPLVLLPLLKIRFLLLAAPLLALAWWHAGRPRKPLIAMGIVLAAVTTGILVHNSMVYGNALKIHSTAELGLLSTPLSAYAEGGLGLLFDAAFGLAGSFPIWLLVLPALFLTARELRPLLFDAAVVSLPYLVVVASRREWYGGWSPPFRYALVGLPLLALALVPLLRGRRRRGARVAIAALGTSDAGSHRRLADRARLDLQLRRRQNPSPRPARGGDRPRRGAPGPEHGPAAAGDLVGPDRLRPGDDPALAPPVASPARAARSRRWVPSSPSRSSPPRCPSPAPGPPGSSRSRTPG